MSRPKCHRNIGLMPENNYFCPKGATVPPNDEVHLSLDEFEAVRLAYYEGMYHEQAAAMMGISRPTFGRIMESAHNKIADFLVNGKALRITGGETSYTENNLDPCESCIRAKAPCRRGSAEKGCPYCRKKAKRDRGETHEDCIAVTTEPDR